MIGTPSPYGYSLLSKRESLYNSVTDYLTFKSDFFKLVEFVEWLKENYPEKILSYKE